MMHWTSLLMLLSMLCWKALPDSTACHSWRLVFASLPVLYLKQIDRLSTRNSCSRAGSGVCREADAAFAATLLSGDRV